MSLKSTAGLAALVACAGLAVPATALGRGDGHRGGGLGFRGGDVPSRVATPLGRALRALERAEERVEDGESDRAVASLTSVRKNLSSALKATKRRVSGDDGPDSARALARVQHRVVLGTASLFDGQDGAVVDGLASTLDAALDGRDDLVASIVALDADARSNYVFVFEQIVEDTADEASDLQEAKEDDTLTSAAAAAIDAALAQVAATGTAAQAQVGAEADDGDYPGADYVSDMRGDGRECRGRRGSRGGDADYPMSDAA